MLTPFKSYQGAKVLPNHKYESLPCDLEIVQGFLMDLELFRSIKEILGTWGHFKVFSRSLDPRFFQGLAINLEMTIQLKVFSRTLIYQFQGLFLNSDLAVQGSWGFLGQFKVFSRKFKEILGSLI